MDKNLLSRVVMPEAKDKDYRDLFFRWSVQETGAFGKGITTLNELYFNTWMNLFAPEKWFHYCALDNLYLGLKVKGLFCVEIIGSNRNVAFNRIDERLFFSEFSGNGTDTVYIPIQNPQKYDAVYFILRYEKNTEFEFLTAGWYTDTMPQFENSLAIVTCTYKREDYIYKTISMFEEYLNQNPKLQDRIRLFVIDNGQTLSLGENCKYTKLFYNMNAGGAGGFGRGLIEVCKSKETYTRCLFMDDDVEILPESFYRTLILADYLKPEFSDSFINGAMLDIYNRHVFFENLGMRDGLWVRPYHSEANLFDYNEILRVNQIPYSIFDKERKVHCGWYCCSFAIDQKQNLNNLPLPIFIRGDDVEWSWRNAGKNFISMNGICIWHAPFHYIVSKVVDNYYLVRNMFLLNTLYTERFRQEFPQLLKDSFAYLISSYDYVAARIMIYALNDILKGIGVYSENPVEIMQTLNSIAQEDYRDTDDMYLLFDVRNKDYRGFGTRKLINKTIKFLYRKVPSCKCRIKRNSMNHVADWHPPIEAFLVKKQVRVYNLMEHTYTTRRFDFKLEKTLTKEFHEKLEKIVSRYEELEKEYKAGFKTITSYDFWRRYLKLSE